MFYMKAPSPLLVLAVSTLFCTTSQQEFSCQGRTIGYYAVQARQCQTYQLCGPGGVTFQFDCPPGTRFNQQYLVCDHPYRVKCDQAERYFDVNLRIGVVPDNALSQKKSTPMNTRQSVFPAASLTGRAPSQAPSGVARFGFQPTTRPSPHRPVNTFASTQARGLPTNGGRTSQGTSERRQPFIQSNDLTDNRPQNTGFSQGGISNFKSASASSFSSNRNGLNSLNARATVAQKQRPAVQSSSRFNSLSSQRHRPVPGLRSPSRNAVSRPTAAPKARLDVGSALVDLAGFIQQNSRQTFHATNRELQRSQQSAASSATTPPRLKNILTQVAALGNTPTQIAPLSTSSGGASSRVAEARTHDLSPDGSTFFRPQVTLAGAEVRAVDRSRALVSRAPQPTRRRSGSGRASRAGGAGWTPARAGAAQATHDGRCPGCLSSLVVSWNACFPCVSPL